MEYPPLVDIVKDVWPSDVIERAQELQTEIGSIGAYSHSKGVPLIRKHVAKFIEGTYMPLFMPAFVHVLSLARTRWISL